MCTTNCEFPALSCPSIQVGPLTDLLVFKFVVDGNMSSRYRDNCISEKIKYDLRVGFWKGGFFFG